MRAVRLTTWLSIMGIGLSSFALAAAGQAAASGDQAAPSGDQAAASGDQAAASANQPPGAAPGSASQVRGQVSISLPGVRLADVSPVVVYLTALEGRLRYTIPEHRPKIAQKNARFKPSFLVIAVGQTVSIPNRDGILHNVFSYSEAKQFDLGLYPKGEQRAVTFPKPGVVPLYCSIHASMNATILVAPSPYHAIVSRAGSFTIRNAPPGRYRLKTWSRKLPPLERTIEVKAGKATVIDLRFEQTK
jgi:hypothetical protein